MFRVRFLPAPGPWVPHHGGMNRAKDLVFEAIPAAELEKIRAAGRDEAGNSLAVQTDTPHEYPPELSDWQQVVRAYDRRGRIADGRPVADGREAQAVIGQWLAQPGVQRVHVRNVGYGCFNFAVRRG